MTISNYKRFCVGTLTRHQISFPYSVIHFTSQLSFLCLHTNPHTDPDNSILTTTAKHSLAPYVGAGRRSWEGGRLEDL